MKQSPKTHVLLVGGSPRAGGNTETLLKETAAGIEAAGVGTTLVMLRSYTIHSCDGCERCRRDETCTRFYDGMHLLYPLIEEARGLVLGSPTYNYNITPEIKSFIDRCYPYFDFSEQRPGPYRSRLAGQGRKMVSLGVCEQQDEHEMRLVIPALSDPLTAMGYEVVEKVAVTGHFPKGAVKGDEEALERARRAGAHLAEALTA
ncbi:MAG: flavodoxin family protein [Spirochaetota bacterium]